ADHVAMLLDQAVYHIEHLRLGISDAPAQAAVSSVNGTAAEAPGAVLAAGQLRITAAGILRVRSPPRSAPLTDRRHPQSRAPLERPLHVTREAAHGRPAPQPGPDHGAGDRGPSRALPRGPGRRGGLSRRRSRHRRLPAGDLAGQPATEPPPARTA